MKVYGSLAEYAENIFDAAAVSILWLVCCIPLVTIGASTSALYYTVNKVWKQERGYVSQEFFRSFRMNLKPSVPVWLVLSLLTGLLQLNLGIVRAKATGDAGMFLMMFYQGCLLIIWGIGIYVFAVLARFDMPAGWIVKLSVYLCFRHPVRTAVLLAVTAAAVWAACRIPLLLLLLPFVTQYLYNYVLEPVLMLHSVRSGLHSTGDAGC